EGLGVDDQETARLEVAQMNLESGRVHRDQAVQSIARRVHTLAAELELEARHAEERAGRCADLRGKVGQRGEVVPGPRRLGRELLTRELHAVAGVAGDRKSTRLNSSHDQISYAVFCLK